MGETPVHETQGTHTTVLNLSYN